MAAAMRVGSRAAWNFFLKQAAREIDAIEYERVSYAAQPKWLTANNLRPANMRRRILGANMSWHLQLFEVPYESFHL